MLSTDQSFIDFNSVLDEWTLNNSCIQISTALSKSDLNNRTDRSFIVIDSDSIEDSDDYLTDKDWSLILDSKNHKILFHQNLFTIKNHIVKKGTNSNK